LAWIWRNTPATKIDKHSTKNPQETAMATTTKASVATTKKTAKAAPTETKTIGGMSIKPTARTKDVDPDQRRYCVEVAAYYIAERRGFMGGHEAEDWTAAEVEIDRMLGEGKLNR